jgi:hypothetical protein
MDRGLHATARSQSLARQFGDGSEGAEALGALHRDMLRAIFASSLFRDLPPSIQADRGVQARMRGEIPHMARAMARTEHMLGRLDSNDYAEMAEASGQRRDLMGELREVLSDAAIVAEIPERRRRHLSALVGHTDWRLRNDTLESVVTGTLEEGAIVRRAATEQLSIQLSGRTSEHTGFEAGVTALRFDDRSAVASAPAGRSSDELHRSPDSDPSHPGTLDRDETRQRDLKYAAKRRSTTGAILLGVGVGVPGVLTVAVPFAGMIAATPGVVMAILGMTFLAQGASQESRMRRGILNRDQQRFDRQIARRARRNERRRRQGRTSDSS